MKHEKRLTALTAAALAFVTAWGAVGCMISAFDLNLENQTASILVCGMVSLLSAVLFSFRRGSTVILCFLALAAGYIYQNGTAAEQFLQLLHRLTTIYDRAYGLGVLQLTDVAWDAGFSDWPLAILGAAVSMAVTGCIVRQRSVWLPMAVTLLPLSSCIVVTDTVPGTLWLAMVMAGLILLLLTSAVRRENAAQGLRLMAAAALPVILALSGLFLSTPKESYVNRSEILRENILIAAENIPRLMETGMTQLTSQLQSTPSRQVDLSNLGPRIPFTYPVMEVTAQKDGTLYLREQDYDFYNGLGWTATEDREESFPGTTGQGESIVIRTENRMPIRFLPYHPTLETILTDGCAGNPEKETEYTLLRSNLPDNWRQLAYQNTVQAEEWQQYLALPETTRQGAAAFLSGLYPENASNTEKADVIAALVTNSARYDLDPDKMPASEPDFALWFLRDGERGYCIHFATATAVLLRAANVPARYVTGYMLEAHADEAVTVTEENAHAWAEYFEPNLGVWLPLEATPAEELPPETAPTHPVTKEPTLPTEKETSPETTEAPADTAPPTDASSPPTEPEPTGEPPVPAKQKTHPMAALLPALLALILAVQRSIRLNLRRRLQRTGDANKQALARWREALRLSRLLKESPTEELIVLAQKAKFSQHELSQEELLQFDSFNRSCLRRLKAKPWYLRLIHQYIYAAY